MQLPKGSKKAVAGETIIGYYIPFANEWECTKATHETTAEQRVEIWAKSYTSFTADQAIPLSIAPVASFICQECQNDKSGHSTKKTELAGFDIQ